MSSRSPVEIVEVSLLSSGSALWRMGQTLCATVVAKATFGMVPEGAARVVAPEKVVVRDRHFDGDPARSVEAASEVAPCLAKAGVLLVGHAYAPGGRPAPYVAVRLGIARERPLLDKTIHVFGDRAAASPGQPAPFQRMPLRYERAFGGPGHDANPVGTGAVPGSPLPNLIHPEDAQRPAGFGPIAASWPARRGLLGREDRARVERDVPELHAAFPFASLHPAPPDQQLDALVGDEWIVLDGLHPALPRVRTRLPSVRALALAAFAGRPLQPIALAPDLLTIHADMQTCSLVWRGRIPLPGGEAELASLRVILGFEVAGHPVQWPAVNLASPEAAPRAAPLPEAAPAAPLVAPPSAVAAKDPASRAPGEDAGEPGGEGGATMTLSLAELEARRRAALPFARRPEPKVAAPPPPVAPPPEAPANEEHQGTAVFSLADFVAASRRPATPFAEAPPSSRAVPAAPAPPPPGSPWAAPAPPPPGSPWAVSPAPIVPAAHDLPPPSRAFGPPAPPPDLPPRAAVSPGPPAPPVQPPRGAPKASPSSPPEPPARGDKVAVPIVNATPLVVATLPWQVRPPKDSLTVVVKGTCDLVHGGPAALRAEGDFPTGDLYEDDDPGKPLVYASDCAPFKPRADVTLTGTAHAPKSAGRGTPAMEVSFQFGAGSRGFLRRVAVLGNRRWQGGMLKAAATDPEPFATMPLTWERAFGGPAFDANPVGAGHKAQAGADGIARLPNLEDPAHLVRSPGDAPAPACFAPVPPQWKERWSKLGTYDRRWLKTRWPYYPEDFDWGFCQGAPRAQQLPYLGGDEGFAIVGMRPDAPKIEGRLPGVRARCFLQMTTEAGGEFRELPLVLDTAAFDVDAMKLSLVWRAFVEVSDEEAPEIEAIFVTTEDLAAAPKTLAEAREEYVRVATPAPPEASAPAPPPARAGTVPPPADDDIAAARAQVLRDLAAAGLPSSPAEGPPPEAPPPDPAAVEASLRAAGASDDDVRDVLAAIAPAPPEAEEVQARDVRARVIAMLEAGAPFDGLDLAGADLADLDFAGRSLAGTVLKGARLARSSFAGANLEGAVLARADLGEAVFEGANLALAVLVEADATRATFPRARLDEADFTGARLDGAAFDEASGASTQFARATLAGASFRGVTLDSADFSAANLEGAVFDKAQLPEVRLYDAIAHGASFRGAAMKGARAEGMKAAKAVFANVAAPGSVWERAKLDEASFHGAALAGASFARASCPAAVFSTADLKEARFRRAKLGGAALLRANLMAATFEGADLRSADLRGANLHAAETWKAKLDGAKLDQAIVTGSKLA